MAQNEKSGYCIKFSKQKLATGGLVMLERTKSESHGRSWKCV